MKYDCTNFCLFLKTRSSLVTWFLMLNNTKVQCSLILAKMFHHAKMCPIIHTNYYNQFILNRFHGIVCFLDLSARIAKNSLNTILENILRVLFLLVKALLTKKLVKTLSWKVYNTATATCPLLDKSKNYCQNEENTIHV